METRHILLYIVKIVLFTVFVMNQLHYFKNTFDSKYIEDIFSFFLALFTLYLFYPLRKQQIEIDCEDRLLLFGIGFVLLYGIDYKNIFYTTLNFFSKKNIKKVADKIVSTLKISSENPHT